MTPINVCKYAVSIGSFIITNTQLIHAHCNNAQFAHWRFCYKFPFTVQGRARPTMTLDLFVINCTRRWRISLWANTWCTALEKTIWAHIKKQCKTPANFSTILYRCNEQLREFWVSYIKFQLFFSYKSDNTCSCIVQYAQYPSNFSEANVTYCYLFAVLI